MPIQKTHSQVQSIRTRKKGKSRAAIEMGSHEQPEDGREFRFPTMAFETPTETLYQ